MNIDIHKLEPIKIIFICLGNICRSPAAEGVMQKLVDDNGLSDKIILDSAGTNGYHDGEKADRRMIYAASKRGYNLTHISRKLRKKDFEDFDLMIVMDKNNYNNVSSMCPDSKYLDKIKYMTQYCTVHKTDIVPDPYYGGEQGFENVLNLLEDACSGLLDNLK